ncbi:A/G-specific adenine glycosylase [Rhodovulum sp. DZ06]|uniref:A/G-specific adenine glycosylase n=1 Tax=Rhodovulum sp. DZ06 TaxID=3425126 RepID=UPI003D3517A1
MPPGNDDAAALSATLLAWYDRHARALPWRIGPAAREAGHLPDPYRVWLSEIMLQQTTVAAVISYFNAFTARWPTVEALAAAADAEVMEAWAGLGYYARARNLLKCARAVAQEHGGAFPDTEEALLKLPGIGPYTAAAIAAIAFDRPAAVLDGNVERVTARLRAIETPLPDAKPRLRAIAAELTPGARPGCHAQAMMDLGATICTPKAPACGICPWRDPCAARAAGIAPELPRKAPKKPKPVRRGVAFVALSDAGEVALEVRPEKGLLGGMPGLPGTEWTEAPPAAPETCAPCPADWRAAGEVRHVFTHFALILEVRTAALPPGTPLSRGAWRADAPGQAGNLPTVMKKALLLALSARR